MRAWDMATQNQMVLATSKLGKNLCAMNSNKEHSFTEKIIKNNNDCYRPTTKE